MSLAWVRQLPNTAATFIITLFGLICITFFIGRIVPIDPVAAIVGDKAPQEVYDRVYHELGMDKPAIVQFGKYVLKSIRGDFGTSFVTNRPVLQDIIVFFPATLELATVGILIGIFLGIPAGVVAAVWRDRWIDHLIRIVGLVGYSIPFFWLALVCLFVFYAKLDLVGGPGRLDTFFEDIVPTVTGMLIIDALLAGEWEVLVNALYHLLLPGLLLGYISMAYISRMTRSVMLEQLTKEYMITARVKGLGEIHIVFHHALRNAMIPMITVIALTYGYLLEGSVLLETIFAWPGLGNYIASSLLSADMNAVLGGTLLVGTIFIVLNMISDILYRILDPRSR